MITFGEQIAKLRNSLGYSQQALADLLGISKSALAMYEKNNREPNFAITIKFADFFNVSLDELIGRTDKRSVSSENRSDDDHPLRLEETLWNLHQGLQNGQYTLDGQPMPESLTTFALASLDAIQALARALQEQRPSSTSS